MGQLLINEDIRFCEIMPRHWLCQINDQLVRSFGAPPGTEIPFRDIRPVERRGAVYWAYMEAHWGQAWLVFKVRYVNMNKNSLMYFSKEEFLLREEIEVGNVA